MIYIDKITVDVYIHREMNRVYVYKEMVIMIYSSKIHN